MIQLPSVHSQNRAVGMLLSLLRKGADAIALAAAAIVGLVLAGLLEGHLPPERVVLAAQAAFWLAGLAFLRWLLPSGQPLRLGRAISGSVLILSAGIACVLFLSAALSKGIPAPSVAISLALGVESLVFFSALAAPAVLLGRRLASLPEPPPPSDDQSARRHQEALSIVFHELRRPLTTLISASELALDTTIAEEERTQLLQSVHRQALRLGDFLEEILETARIQSGGLRVNPRPLDLRSLVKELCEEFEEAHSSHDLRLIGGKQTMPVAADPAKLRMVLSNLLANAAAYSPPGSTITVRLLRGEEAVAVQVEDEGSGVPEPYRQQIFEQFFRIPGTQERGFGLGLYIARQLLLAQGGTIEVDSRQPRGSRFTIALPALRRGSLVATVSSAPEASSPTLRRPRPATPDRKAQPSKQDTAELPGETARR